MNESGNQSTPRPLPDDESITLQQDVYAKQEDLFSVRIPEEAG